MYFLSYVSQSNEAKYVNLEDFADRLNFQWNIIVLFMCSALVTVITSFKSASNYGQLVQALNRMLKIRDVKW